MELETFDIKFNNKEYTLKISHYVLSNMVPAIILIDNTNGDKIVITRWGSAPLEYGEASISDLGIESYLISLGLLDKPTFRYTQLDSTGGEYPIDHCLMRGELLDRWLVHCTKNLRIRSRNYATARNPNTPVETKESQK